MDKETMDFLQAMQDKILSKVDGLEQELKGFRAEFKEHAVQTDEKLCELLNVVKDSKDELKNDIKDMRDYMEGLAETQGRQEQEIKFLKKRVI